MKATFAKVLVWGGALSLALLLAPLKIFPLWISLILTIWAGVWVGFVTGAVLEALEDF
jgi:hypothetical protein